MERAFSPEAGATLWSHSISQLATAANGSPIIFTREERGRVTTVFLSFEINIAHRSLPRAGRRL